MLGTEFVLKSISALGVEHIFMFVGGLVDPFLPAVAAGIVTPIVAANEAGAGYAADGYARAAGKFGAVLVIGGPGAFNVVGAVGAADADRVPLLLLTGETATSEQGRGSFQDATGFGEDDLLVFEGITAGSHLVPTPQALPQFLRDAYHAMLAHPRRPVHLALPVDVQKAELGNPKWHPRATLEPPRVLDEAAFGMLGRNALGTARNIAILAGNGSQTSGAGPELQAFCEKFQIPIASTFRAKGIVPEDHELCLGMFGYAGHPPAEECLTCPELDLLIVLGSSLNQRDTLAWNARLKPKLGIAQVNVDEAQLGRNFPVEYAILGDVRTAVRALSSGPWTEHLAATASERRAWADGFLKQPRFLEADKMTSDQVPMHPARVVTELRNALPRDAALLIDSGAHRAFAGHYFQVYQPRRLFSATGLGPMGWAIAASIGVAAALPDTLVAVVTGDGCMLQNGLEIQTAARHRMRILYVVINNSALGNVYLRARQDGPAAAALTELPTHNWADFAESLGVLGRLISEPSELKPALEDWLTREGPMLLDVRCDRDVGTPVAPWVEAKRHPDIYAE